MDADATYDPVNFNFPHGTHLCAMEVDTETGQVTMRKYVCCDDIGNIINPIIVCGQVHGGLVQGIAQALWEEAVYDDSGTLVSGSFVDYLLPTAADTIRFDIDHTQPVDDEHARHQGRGRGGHDRVHAGRGERGRRRRPPVRGQRHHDAVHARARVEGDQHSSARAGRPRVRRCRTSTPTNPAPAARKERAHDSRQVRLPGADRVSRRRWPRWPQHGDDAKIMAGGQSLLPVLRMRLNAPEVVIDLGRIDGLRGIREDGDALVIGALTTHAEVVDSDLVKRARAAAVQGGGEVADPQIRHRGTFGGALAHADPAGDLGAAGAGTGVEFVIAGSGGTRTVAADEFFVDLFETAIGEDEILTEIRVPKHTGWGAHYEKFIRVAQQWPIVAVAVDGARPTAGPSPRRGSV